MSRIKTLLFQAARRFPFLHRWLPKGLKDRLFLRVYNRPPERLPYAPGAFAPGVQLFGFLSASLGLGQGARLYERALQASGIPYVAIDTTGLLPGGEGQAMTLPDLPYQVHVVHLNPDMLPVFFQQVPPGFWDRRYVIGVWLWELPEIPESWKALLPLFDEIWAPSHFIEQAISRETQLPVTFMPYGILAPMDEGLSRADFGLPQEAFLVLCMFDLNSYVSRKNPAASIDAFFRAFPGREDVRLVLKMHSASDSELSVIRGLVGDDPRVVLMHEDMEKTRVNRLIALSDVLISLHRSEGFGLIMAEAMALGVPVVATDWSANTDFMDADCACMVQYKLISTEGAYIAGQRDQLWADPDVGQAAVYLRRLYEEPDFRRLISGAARQRIEQRFSIAASAERMRADMDKIWGQETKSKATKKGEVS